MKIYFNYCINFFALICNAEIYMQKDSNGNITYSDIPLNNSSKIELPQGNHVSSTDQTKETAPELAESNNNSACCACKCLYYF